MSSDASFTDPLDRTRRAAEAVAPVVWLFGKAQAGKTSVVAELTGRDRDEVGNGFQRATMSTKVYSFPEDMPVVRFLDTRGVEDEADVEVVLDEEEERAHLLLVVVRLEDAALDRLLEMLKGVRRRHPDWPMIVAQTRLHDLYAPGADHPRPYPFDGTEADGRIGEVPENFRRALMAQREVFAGLSGVAPVFVALDFTPPEAGYMPLNYGGEALWEALKETLPSAYERLHRGRDPGENARRQVIVPWAFAAAGADAVPAPFIGGLASSGLQARMVMAIAGRFGLELDRALWSKFVRLLGLAFGMRYGAKFLLRQGLKMLPGVGTAAVAVWSFGVTYALGEAAVYFCREVAAGREPDREAMRETYAVNLERAREVWRRQTEDAGEGRG